MTNGSGAFVVSGPTAVGKGTVVSALRRRHPELYFSVSATTRHPRPGEINGVHYYFVDEDEFDHLAKTGGLLEWAVVHGVHRYGTPRQPVIDALEDHQTVILEIDLQGARQIRQSLPEAKHVLLVPPDWDELVRRLVHRGTESESEIRRRLDSAKNELAASGEFDYVVENASVEKTVDDLVSLIGL